MVTVGPGEPVSLVWTELPFILNHGGYLRLVMSMKRILLLLGTYIRVYTLSWSSCVVQCTIGKYYNYYCHDRHASANHKPVAKSRIYCSISEINVTADSWCMYVCLCAYVCQQRSLHPLYFFHSLSSWSSLVTCNLVAPSPTIQSHLKLILLLISRQEVV